MHINPFKSYPQLAPIVYDICAIPFAWFAAYWLRFNLAVIPAPYWQSALHGSLLLLSCQCIAYFFMGLQRGLWRFASLSDSVRIIKTILLGVTLSVVSLFLFTRMSHVPRSIFPLYGMFLAGFWGGGRLLMRLYYDYGRTAKRYRRVLIVGAGIAGETMARDLLRHPNSDLLPVAFVDDAPSKLGKDIHGIPVLGKCCQIPHLAITQSVELIMLAIPSADSATMRRLVEYCDACHVPYRTLPSVLDLTEGRVTIDTLRKVSLEDLLGRDPIVLDWHTIKKGLCNKTILVTGCGGSIGSELCRQIVALNPREIIAVDNTEFNLYQLQMELNGSFPAIKVSYLLEDVSDKAGMQHIFETYAPQIVFHSAAYKHVPLLQQQVRSAVKNNILTTRVMVELASRFKAEKFVLISTDKAVNPHNIMGATKRIAEMICQNSTTHLGTQCITVRFGNVLGSAGSVVPLFQQQINAGGPITVTHPEITRFFMTIPESVQLIMQATVMGKGGEIYILNMGKPIKIRYLAEQMIRLAAGDENKTIKISYTGLRPGEKLYEELFHAEEQVVSTAYDKILQAQARHYDKEWLDKIVGQMEQAVYCFDEDILLESIQRLVPEFQYQGNFDVNNSLIANDSTLIGEPT
ncbi:MAG: polysaccharide biosynthesis protein [Gammaproteobacteria bacterium]